MKTTQVNSIIETLETKSLSVTVLDRFVKDRKEALKVLRAHSKAQAELWPYIDVHSKALRQINKIERANGSMTLVEFLYTYEDVAKNIVNNLDNW